MFSYSYYKAQARDPRYRVEEKYYNWHFDFRHVLTVSGGYKIKFHEKSWFNELKRKKWWRAVAWLPFAPTDEFQIGVRYRYLGGRPYTPLTYNPTFREWHESPQQELNSARLKPYNRLDIMFIQRRYYKKMNLAVFFNIMNIQNRFNVWGIQYLPDGTRSEIAQFTLFPVGGFILEF